MNYQKEFYQYATAHHHLNGEVVNQFMSYATRNAQHLKGFTPSVMEERQLNVLQMDVFSRLMMDRIVFLGLAIDDYVANVIQAQLLFLESVNPKDDIQMYINSPGGSVTAGLGIYDTMQYISPDVSTICTSTAASMVLYYYLLELKTKESVYPIAES